MKHEILGIHNQADYFSEEAIKAFGSPALQDPPPKVNEEGSWPSNAPQAPLTEAQIRRIERLRGQPVSAADVDGINQHRAEGHHIGYF